MAGLLPSVKVMNKFSPVEQFSRRTAKLPPPAVEPTPLNATRLTAPIGTTIFCEPTDTLQVREVMLRVPPTIRFTGTMALVTPLSAILNSPILPSETVLVTMVSPVLTSRAPNELSQKGDQPLTMVVQSGPSAGAEGAGTPGEAFLSRPWTMMPTPCTPVANIGKPSMLLPVGGRVTRPSSEMLLVLLVVHPS